MTAAQKRAEALLMRHLTPEQQDTYLHHGWFEVQASDGSLWMIDRHGSSNVRRTGRDGTRIYCSDLRDVPRADTLLVQLFCIRATGGRGLPRMQGDTLHDAHLFYKTRRRRRTAVATPDPAALSLAALEHRMMGEFEYAEHLARRAIEAEDEQAGPDGAERRLALALILLAAQRFVDARRVIAEAWRLNASRHDVTSGRILFVRATLALLQRSDARLYLGQLKTLLMLDSLPRRRGTPTWEVSDVFLLLLTAAVDGDLLIEAGLALKDRARVERLEAVDGWKAVSPIPLETAWPSE